MLARRPTEEGLSGWRPADEALGRSFAVMDAMRREMDRWLDDLERAWGAPLGPAEPGSWPAVGLRDQGSELVLRAEVPGFSEHDLELQVERGAVTLRGRRIVDPPEGYDVHRRERGSLQFARTMALPCRIDVDRVDASLHDGVLEVKLPKSAEDQPRQIDIAEI